MKKSVTSFLLCFLFLFSYPNVALARAGNFISGSYCNPDLQQYNAEIDWSEVPELENARDFARYLNDCIEERMQIIPLHFVNGFALNQKTGILPGQKTLAVNAYRWDYYIISSEKNSQKVIYVLYYYPGLRIADAYANGDISNLTADERQVYTIALKFLEELKNVKSDFVKELLIHDKIINLTNFRTVDFSKKNYSLRNISALGVFLDHVGNCQAHSDAFYMLGRMVGLDVGIMRGVAFGGTHMWNTITIDEKGYFVDLSFDRNSFKDNTNKSYITYYYFNAPREIMKANYTWDRSFERDKIQDTVDDNYFYGTQEHFRSKRKYFGISEDSAEQALESVAQGVARNGWKLWYAMVPYDKYYSNVQNVLDYFGEALTNNNWYGNYYINVKTNPHWKYMFYTIIMRKS
ncbi:MAG: hypothetical protein K6G15_01270 [Desulfovibrio sp.]|nr:hypothetical protein [Desulfovibrio sp.]